MATKKYVYTEHHKILSAEQLSFPRKWIEEKLRKIEGTLAQL